MRNLLTILFVCLLPFLPMAQTNHYVSTTGSDTAIGTISRPWATLPYAASQVTTAGDTIQILDGTYTLTQASLIAPGVHVKGQSITGTILKSHYKNNWNSNNPTDAAITFTSSTEGTNGNQSISNLTLDGDALTGNTAIMVKNRSNVVIHDMTIKNFYINGISFFGSAVNDQTKPVTYSTNNKIQNVVIDNCTDSAETDIGGGLINLNGQKDFEISGCTLSDTSRAEGRNGDLLVNNRFGLGLKYFNNTSYKPSSANAWWNFHLEIPNGIAGTEIYNNNFYGGDYCVDIGGNQPYDYNYSYLFSIHDNYFEDKGAQYDGTFGKYCLFTEGAQVRNVFIYNNTFKNIVRPFGLNDGGGGVAAKDSNIVFRNNVSYNTGTNTSTSYLNLIEIQKSVAGSSITGLQIINNTVYPNPTTHTTAIGIMNTDCSIKNLVIANNIFLNATNGYWMTVSNSGSGSIDSLIQRNNILYNNQNSNTVNFTGNPVTNYIKSGDLNSNPLFVSSSDLHLQSGSPAIGAAYPYGYGSDIGGLQYTTVAAPTISMSGNQSITVDSTTISAVATPVSGHTITSYSWTKLSGPTAGTIVSPSSSSTTVTNLSNGTYQYQCIATQDDGQTATGTVTVVVNIPAITNYKINFKVPHVFKNK